MISSKQGQRLGCTTFLLVILMLFQIISLLRVLQLPTSIRAGLQFAPWFQAMLALIWVLLFAVAIVMILRQQRDASQFSSWLIIGFMIYSLLRLIIFAQADYDRQRLPMLAAMTMILLAIPIITLLQPTLHRGRRREEDNDSEYQN